jgi:hypothetical protein
VVAGVRHVQQVFDVPYAFYPSGSPDPQTYTSLRSPQMDR